MAINDVLQRIQEIQDRIQNIRPAPVKHFEDLSRSRFHTQLHQMKAFQGASHEPQDQSFKAPTIEYPQARNTKRDVIDHFIKQASTSYQVPESLVQAVVQAESSYNPKAVSRAGAKGLMQLMPQTAEELGVKDVFDPKENIFAGTRYLKGLLEYFQGNLPLSLAAYNSGIHRVLNAGGIPNIRETKNYVKQVIQKYQKINQSHP